jgi:hypothetical protein
MGDGQGAGGSSSTVRLSRQQLLASFIWLTDDRAVYSYGDDDNPQFLYLMKHIWEEMGRPDNLTLDIQPGDQLNG